MANCEAERILIEEGRVTGVIANKVNPKERQRKFLSKKGERITIRAKRVVVAAGVIQSPLILQRSPVPDPYRLIGSHLMAHPGVSIVGLFDERINIWQGATQGYEVTEFRQQGLKLESLGVSPALFAVRLPGAGQHLAELYEKRSHMSFWAVAVRTKSLGSVSKGRLLSPIRYPVSPADVKQFLMGIEALGRLNFAAGAREVYPGIVGRAEVVRSEEELFAMTRQPTKTIQLHPVATHLFGTCRLSDDPERGVIDHNFESHHVKGLYVVDGSVFPTNTGVNPQLSIMALASVAAKRVMGSF